MFPIAVHDTTRYYNSSHVYSRTPPSGEMHHPDGTADNAKHIIRSAGRPVQYDCRSHVKAFVEMTTSRPRIQHIVISANTSPGAVVPVETNVTIYYRQLQISDSVMQLGLKIDRGELMFHLVLQFLKISPCRGALAPSALRR